MRSFASRAALSFLPASVAAFAAACALSAFFTSRTPSLYARRAFCCGVSTRGMLGMGRLMLPFAHATGASPTSRQPQSMGRVRIRSSSLPLCCNGAAPDGNRAGRQGERRGVPAGHSCACGTAEDQWTSRKVHSPPRRSATAVK